MHPFPIKSIIAINRILAMRPILTKMKKNYIIVNPSKNKDHNGISPARLGDIPPENTNFLKPSDFSILILQT